jgi:hypothetical protein
MKISEIITDKYKLRIPPTVYYELLADVQEVEEEQEPTTKNDLGVDKEQLKTMIRGLTKWYVKRDNTEVGEPNTAVGLLYDDVMFGIDRLSSVTPQEPFINKPCVSNEVCEHDKNKVLDKLRAEIEQLTSRYTISRERGGMGQVEWSDMLIKESEVLEIIDKYKAESENP